MKVFCAQIRGVFENPRKTISHVTPFIKNAADSNGHLICFPEQFATGWDPRSEKHIQDTRGSVVSALRGLAREHGIAILGSYRQRHDPLPKNTSLVIDRNGDIIASYDKCHLFTPSGEGEYYTPGDHLSFFEVGGVRCGIAICYDLRFTSLFHAYALEGCHAVIVPAAWPALRIQHWELFIRSRALDHQRYVLGINTTGITPVECYNGHSLAADPYGTVLAIAGEGEELLQVEIDPDEVGRAGCAVPVTQDRRPDLYHALIRKRSG